jgi:hypothetical protein
MSTMNEKESFTSEPQERRYSSSPKHNFQLDQLFSLF